MKKRKKKKKSGKNGKKRKNEEKRINLKSEKQHYTLFMVFLPQ